MDQNFNNFILEIEERINKRISDELEASDFEVFESIQVYAGCGGCLGTQIACNIPSC